MADYRFVTLDVFTDQTFGGNPLAVLLDARGLDDRQMQLVAREFNYSETTFVLPPKDPAHTSAVRIFTPSAELPFAGHPTIGTAFALVAAGGIAVDGDAVPLVLEEGVGPVPVDVGLRGGRPVGATLSVARLPARVDRTIPVADLAALLGLGAGAIGEAEAFSCGVPFLFVPLRDRATVAAARLDRVAWSRLSAGQRELGLYVFSRDAEIAGADLHARMFFPGAGVDEDPATGSAAAALAGYLSAREERRQGTLRRVIEQGVEMGRPSRLELEADLANGQIEAVRVGGACVLISEGIFHL